MENLDTLQAYGLFNAKVPRYTSYPPANRFQDNVGANVAKPWIAALPNGSEISVYIHIPFCRRLCWFCACRTQGTKTLDPVDGYVGSLVSEIQTVGALLPSGVKMARLHFGGGTPTLLAPHHIDQIMGALTHACPPTPDMEFAVEVDPTEAHPDTLRAFSSWGMNRASVGVQDFAPEVQKAIGRPQSFEQTQKVIETLRAQGVRNLNIDLLYGLPHQTIETLNDSLTQVLTLSPDRIALYGYAHVPQFSKRQVMIQDATLPSPHARFKLEGAAKQILFNAGYKPVGIDHYARPDDTLAKAAEARLLRRNFQGYTDDSCTTLIGFGASAISSFSGGYTQNAVATAAYRAAVDQGALAARKGVVLTVKDFLLSDMISDMMCYGQIDLRKLSPSDDDAHVRLLNLIARYPKALRIDKTFITVEPSYRPLIRVLCAALEDYKAGATQHSSAI